MAFSQFKQGSVQTLGRVTCVGARWRYAGWGLHYSYNGLAGVTLRPDTSPRAPSPKWPKADPKIPATPRPTAAGMGYNVAAVATPPRWNEIIVVDDLFIAELFYLPKKQSESCKKIVLKKFIKFLFFMMVVYNSIVQNHS